MKIKYKKQNLIYGTALDILEPGTVIKCVNSPSYTYDYYNDKILLKTNSPQRPLVEVETGAIWATPTSDFKFIKVEAEVLIDE